MSPGTPTPSAPALVSLTAFHSYIWAGFGIAAVVFSGRAAIRLVTFGRFCLEDYLMLASLATLLPAAILAELYIEKIYSMVSVINGERLPSPDFLDLTSQGLRSFIACQLLANIGIWLVKFSLLFFFRRLGSHVAKYRYVWWLAFIFNLAVLCLCIGIIDYRCSLPPAEVIFATCSDLDHITASHTGLKVTVTMDVGSDIAIIALPTWVVWGCKLGMRQKIALSGIFGLVLITMAVTILRGVIFGGTYETLSGNRPMQLNISWLWFCYNVQHVVAFIVGCLVSFRALYTSQTGLPGRSTGVEERRRRAALHPRSGLPLRGRARRWHAGLAATLMSWETSTTTLGGDDDHDDHGEVDTAASQWERDPIRSLPAAARGTGRGSNKSWDDPLSSVHELTAPRGEVSSRDSDRTVGTTNGSDGTGL